MNASIAAVKLTLSISSPRFSHQDYMPVEYTCEGSGKNPPLAITGLPENTKSMALIMEDPDAPGRVFDHWIVWNIPPTTTIIEEGSVPGKVGKNSAGVNLYTAPCPPSGVHRYYFKVYALDTLLFLEERADKKIVLDSLQSHVLAYGELIGLYKRHAP